MFEGFVCIYIVFQLIITMKILDIVDNISRKMELCYEIIRKNGEI